MRHILFRVDANREIGYGHMARCLSFATTIAKGADYKVSFLTEVSGDLLDRLRETHDFSFYPLRMDGGSPRGEVADIAGGLGKIDLLVLDGYHFADEEFDSLTRGGCSSLFIDDLGQRSFAGDFVMNQNIGSEALYINQVGCRYLTGPRFLLLRDEFQVARERNQRRGTVSILITFGGSDQADRIKYLLNVLKAMGIVDWHVTVLLGGTSRERIEEAFAGSDHDLELIDFTNDVAPYFEEADLVISPAGSTIWELCKMNRSFVTFPLVENQTIVARGVKRFGLGAVIDFCDRSALEASITSILNDGVEQEGFRTNRNKYFADAGMTLEIFKKEIGAYL
jgi:UDP-2,4-diacetamido-2,4,6-trideoxy-beta-L-altropyranose hydrolase